MQGKKTYKYLQFSSFKDLSFWDYYTLTNQAAFDSNFPIEKLSTVLSHRKEFITIDDTKDYKRCRVQLYGNGIILRDIVKGSVIKTKKQQLCKTGDFLVAEIDAKFGGYGVVPKELEGAIVSGHYFLFEIDTQKLLPEFLELVVKCNGFSKQVKATGSTNYAAIRPYHVLDYKIPLPSIPTQQQLISDYQGKISNAKRATQGVFDTEKAIKKAFADLLNLEISTKEASVNRFKIFDYKNLRRWDVWNIVSTVHANCPIVYLHEIIEDISTGTTPPTTNPSYFTPEVNFYTPADLGDTKFLVQSERHVSLKAISEKKARKFVRNTILFVGIGSTIGKVGIVANDYACANQQITGFTVNAKKALSEYVYYYQLFQ